MEHTNVQTSIGTLAIFKKEVPGTVPIIFLHGVYYDHHLWNYQISRIVDRTTVTVDMPLHGQSKAIEKKDWTVGDCAVMLLEILDFLGAETCYAVGHSWGSMTILRAASDHPERFLGIGLCNMPLTAGSWKVKLQFGMQHLLLPFRGFYTRQVAKTMFAEDSLKDRPEIEEYLQFSMGHLSNQSIRKTDKAVITHVDSGLPYLKKLAVPVVALKGIRDYVPTLTGIETILVAGKHTSPLEQPEQVLGMIKRLLGE